MGVWHFRPPHKKLEDAVAYLVGGSGDNDRFDADLDYWNAPESYRPKKRENFVVMPENWESLQVFIGLQTQWRYAGTGHRTGLEYSSIDPVCTAKGIKLTTELFSDLQFMEITLINRELKNVNG